VRWWQDHLTPAWKHLSGGCHLNRAIDELVDAGFRIERLDRGYMRGPRVMSGHREGLGFVGARRLIASSERTFQLRPARLRSAYAADNPIPINIRTADGWPGSPLRHS
jgi:hypothetical protein